MDNVLHAFLKEFFTQQEASGLQTRFIDDLQSDFNKIMEDFVNYCEIKNKTRKIPLIDSNQICKLISQEIFAFKFKCLREHTDMLLSIPVDKGKGK